RQDRERRGSHTDHRQPCPAHCLRYGHPYRERPRKPHRRLLHLSTPQASDFTSAHLPDPMCLIPIMASGGWSKCLNLSTHQDCWRARNLMQNVQNQSSKQNVRLIGLLIALTLLVSACVAPVAPAPASAASEPAATENGDADTVTITHPQGETPVTKNPETVVVFDYSALDTLDQLGVPVAALPKQS